MIVHLMATAEAVWSSLIITTATPDQTKILTVRYDQKHHTRLYTTKTLKQILNPRPEHTTGFPRQILAKT